MSGYPLTVNAIRPPNIFGTHAKFWPLRQSIHFKYALTLSRDKLGLIDLICCLDYSPEELSYNCFLNVEFCASCPPIHFPSFSESYSEVYAAWAELSQTCLRYKKVAVGYNSSDSIEPVWVPSMQSSCSWSKQVRNTQCVSKVGLQAIVITDSNRHAKSIEDVVKAIVVRLGSNANPKRIHS